MTDPCSTPTFTPEETAAGAESSRRLIARGLGARHHRLWHATDLLQGFSDGIDGDRLAAVIEWARDGAALDTGALLRAFTAAHQAAIDEGAWEGDPVAAAQEDIERIGREAIQIQCTWAMAERGLTRVGAMTLGALQQLEQAEVAAAALRASQGGDQDPDADGARYGVTTSTDRSTVQRCEAWFTDRNKAIAWADWLNFGAVWDLVEAKVIWPEAGQ